MVRNMSNCLIDSQETKKLPRFAAKKCVLIAKQPNKGKFERKELEDPYSTLFQEKKGSSKNGKFEDINSKAVFDFSHYGTLILDR